jgi:hypothetical protein
VDGIVFYISQVLFNFVPVGESCRLLVTSWTTVPNTSGFFVGLTGSVSAQIDLADLTSRDSVGHLLVSVAGSSDSVNVHHNALVDLERTDS